jgi:hypothetical protein
MAILSFVVALSCFSLLLHGAILMLSCSLVGATHAHHLRLDGARRFLRATGKCHGQADHGKR